MYYTYILKSEKGKLYIGSSSNLTRRLKEHKAGKSWTTKRMANVELIFYEAFKDKRDALRREKYFKTTKGRFSFKQILRESLK